MAQVLYRDVNQSLDTNYMTDADAVFQSILNILRTKKRTRLFNSEFGSRVEELLFEPMDVTTELAIYAEVVDSIKQWEPRAILDEGKSNVVADYENHVYWVDLVFRVKGLTGTYTYSFGLKK